MQGLEYKVDALGPGSAKLHRCGEPHKRIRLDKGPFGYLESRSHVSLGPANLNKNCGEPRRRNHLDNNGLCKYLEGRSHIGEVCDASANEEGALAAIRGRSGAAQQRLGVSVRLLQDRGPPGSEMLKGHW